METEIVLKTADKTKYMREYKRKQYEEQPELIKAKNKSYYFKNKYGLSNDDMKQFDVYLPLVAKIRKNLDELKEKKPEFIRLVLNSYLESDKIE